MQADKDEEAELRRGFWRAILRIHKGRPGLPGTGTITPTGEFVGGLAGIRVGWAVGPSEGMPLIDAIPVAGFYCFGSLWPSVVRNAGLPRRADDVITRLREEFPEEERRIAIELTTPPDRPASAERSKPERRTP